MFVSILRDSPLICLPCSCYNGCAFRSISSVLCMAPSPAPLARLPSLSRTVRRSQAARRLKQRGTDGLPACMHAGVDEAVVGAAVVLCNLLAAPLMFVTAKMAAISLTRKGRYCCPANSYEHYSPLWLMRPASLDMCC